MTSETSRPAVGGRSVSPNCSNNANSSGSSRTSSHIFCFFFGDFYKSSLQQFFHKVESVPIGSSVLRANRKDSSCSCSESTVKDVKSERFQPRCNIISLILVQVWRLRTSLHCRDHWVTDTSLTFMVLMKNSAKEIYYSLS